MSADPCAYTHLSARLTVVRRRKKETSLVINSKRMVVTSAASTLMWQWILLEVIVLFNSKQLWPLYDPLSPVSLVLYYYKYTH